MSIERYNSNGRFHEAVIHNGVIYVSGQVAVPGATVAEQAEGCLENLAKTLEKYGSDKEHILSVSVFLADVADFDEFNSVWDNWFEEGTQPARTCVEAALAIPGTKVEITLVAAVKEV